MAAWTVNGGRPPRQVSVALDSLTETESRRGTGVTVSAKAGQQRQESQAHSCIGWHCHPGVQLPIVAGPPVTRIFIGFAIRIVSRVEPGPLMTIAPPGATALVANASELKGRS